MKKLLAFLCCIVLMIILCPILSSAAQKLPTARMDDIVVGPLIETYWNQSTIHKFDVNGLNMSIRSPDVYPEIPYYNWYTTWDIYGESRRFLVGCGALTIGQFVHQQQYPSTLPNNLDKDYPVHLISTYLPRGVARLKGIGKSYNWDLMDNSPDYDRYRRLVDNDEGEDSTSPENQSRKETAALLHDMGILLSSGYGAEATGSRESDIHVLA